MPCYIVTVFKNRELIVLVTVQYHIHSIENLVQRMSNVLSSAAM